ncbi:hypothetical protein [uncultured Cohaesibacter sp.]|uniref:hypothetical protein n=1 Tax=uncultured Cohaesibacter sp. TaxID=1002546 RepID=UPI002AA8F66C|nr:hypothetical protein [uncultured Cohaesibacter sp.]
MTEIDADQKKTKNTDYNHLTKLRRNAIKLSFIVFVIVPTILTTFYYAFIASEQYEVETRFSVRGVETSVGGGGVLSLLTGVPESGSTTSDSYILMDYVFSATLVDTIDQSENLVKIYGPEKADFLSTLSPDASLETKLKFWKKMISIDYDSRSQVIALSVRAFTPVDALRMSDKLLELCQILVNNMSLAAREDALSFSKAKVDELEQKLIKAQEEVLTFRNANKVIDPKLTAASRSSSVEEMKNQVSTARVELQSLEKYLDPDSPRIQVLKAKIESLERQAKADRSSLGQNEDGVPQLIKSYETLLLQKGFAEKRYLSALASLETSRLKASQKQKYLAVFAKPILPQDPSYPNRIVSSIFTFVISSLLWVIAVLIVYAVRDHAN